MSYVRHSRAFFIGLAISLSLGSLAYIGKISPEEDPDLLSGGRPLDHHFREGAALSGSVIHFDLDADFDFRDHQDWWREAVEKLPWSDSFWPSSDGGIAYRYDYVRTKTGESGLNSRLYSCEELAAMSPQRRFTVIESLSPAEKIAIVYGRCNPAVPAEWYPLVMKERDYYTNMVERDNEMNRQTGRGGSSRSWDGLCNGWAKAAILFKEPSPKRVKTILSIGGRSVNFEINFLSSDIKSLASHYYAREAKEQKISTYVMVGRACRETVDGGLSQSCEGINPGTFHMLLTNLIGARHESFYVDADPSPQIWNYPLISYSSRVLGEYQPRIDGAEKEVLIETDVIGATETYPEAERIMAQPKHFVFSYYLDLARDASGEYLIVGGYWKGTQHPDYAAIPKLVPFAGDFRLLYDPARPEGALIQPRK